jgi:FkbM family methyltransferase
MSKAFVAHTRRTGRRVARLAKETLSLPNRRRNILRWAAFASVRRFTATVSADVDGIDYFVRTADQSVGRLLFMGVVPDGDLFAAALTLIEQQTGRPTLADRTFVEVGANIGTTTLPAALRHDARRVVALEPAHECLRLLRASLAANDLDERRVLVLPVAASYKEGIAEFEVSSANSGDGRVRVGTGARGPDVYGEVVAGSSRCRSPDLTTFSRRTTSPSRTSVWCGSIPSATRPRCSTGARPARIGPTHRPEDGRTGCAGPAACSDSAT